MKKIIFFLTVALAIWISPTAGAQDTLYWCDFDQPSDSAGWLMLNGGQPHYWTIGIDSSMSSNALMVADLDTFANYYGHIRMVSFSYACHYMTLSRGVYHFRYDWRCVGWNGWEQPFPISEDSPSNFMRVALMPESAGVLSPGYAIDGQRFSPTYLPFGGMALDGDTALTEWRVAGMTGGEVAPLAGWHTYECDLVIEDSGTYCLVFSWYTENPSHVIQPPAAIDNLLVTSYNCPPPTNISVENLTSSSLELSWLDLSQGHAAQWLVELHTDYDTIDEGTLFATEDTTLSIVGLSSNTDYTLYFRSLCGTDTSEAVAELHVHTPCELFWVPYSQDFGEIEDSLFVPCWARLGIGSSNIVCVDRMLRWNNNNDYSAQYVVLPGINTARVAVRDLQLSFKTKGVGHFDVGVMTNPANTDSFERVATVGATVSSWRRHVIEFNNYTGDGNYVAIRVGGEAVNANLDEFAIDFSVCHAVNNLSVADVDMSSALVTWNVDEGTRHTPDSFEVCLQQGILFTANGIRQTTTEHRCPLLGLAPGTYYVVGVRAICENGSLSEWRYVGFQTPALICQALDSSLVDTNVLGTDTLWSTVSGHSEVILKTIYSAEELHQAGVEMGLVGVDYSYAAGRSDFDVAIYVGRPLP